MSTLLKVCKQILISAVFRLPWQRCREMWSLRYLLAVLHALTVVSQTLFVMLCGCKPRSSMSTRIYVGTQHVLPVNSRAVCALQSLGAGKCCTHTVSDTCIESFLVATRKLASTLSFPTFVS